MIDFKVPQVVVCLGKPKRGKSNTTKWFILKNSVDNRHFQFGLVFSRTAQMSEDYDYIPDEYIYDTYESETLQQYLLGLQQLKDDNGNIPPNFIIFDDQQGLINRNCPVLQNFVACHRHYNTSVFWNFQYLYGSSPLIRECSTLAVLYNSKGERTLQGIYENFGQLFPNFRTFKDHFMNLTSEKYVGMLYQQDIDEITENYKYFKSPDMTKYKIKLDY